MVWRKRTGHRRDVKMERANKAESPFLFFVVLIPLLILNYLALIHPILVEWILLSAPLANSEFDIWLVSHIFGTFTYGSYLLLWMGSYFLSFIVGFLVALFTSKPLFGKLVKNHEVIVGQMELAARLVFDFSIGALVAMFTFNSVLSLVTAHTYELVSRSVISLAVLTGFATGNVVLKCVLLFIVYIKCKRDFLVLESVYLPEEKGKRSHFRKIRWSLQKKISSISNS